MMAAIQNIKSKKKLSLLLLILLCLPLFQYYTGILNIGPLKGSYDKLEKPDFSVRSWFNGEYQNNYQEYFDENIGFRSFFVRIYNQVHYVLYNEARANGIIIGKKKYLYAKNYIRTHLGSDFIGRDSIKGKVGKIQMLNDTLQKKGIDLIVLFAPGKGSFYPEFFPKPYDTIAHGVTNYEVYREELQKSDIKFLDFNGWFRNMKDTSSYPLFPKTGIHWSKYGEIVAADSIIKYINSIQEEFIIPEMAIERIETSRKMRDTDDDIEKGMNILFDIKDLKMGYPQFKWIETPHTNQPKVLTVADSYYWGMFNYGISRDAFNNGQFWFYNQDIYPKKSQEPLSVKDINLKEEVEKNDIILLLSTDANLYKFAFGFIEQLFDCYYPNFDDLQLQKNEERTNFYINAIRETPQWLKKVTKKAQSKNISIEEAIREDAKYMVRQEKEKGDYLKVSPE